MGRISNKEKNRLIELLLIQIRAEYAIRGKTFLLNKYDLKERDILLEKHESHNLFFEFIKRLLTRI